MSVFQGGSKKWSMLSKRERRLMIINSLSIPKYLRFYIADQDRDTVAKRKFHGHLELLVKSCKEPDFKQMKVILREVAGSPFKRFILFMRFVFIRK